MKIHLQGRMDTREVILNNTLLDPAKSQDITNHSPDGFNWGYPGSGPAQLALAICLELFGEQRALVYHQFMSMYISALPQEDFDEKINITNFILDYVVCLPWIVIKPGKIVVNHSSNHGFEFADGSILGGCDVSRCSENFIEWSEEYLETTKVSGCDVDLIRPTPYLTKHGKEDLLLLDKYLRGDALVIVPRPILDACKNGAFDEDIYMSTPFVTGRLKHRADKILFISKFCK